MTEYIAKRYVASAPTAEYAGGVLSALVTNVQASVIKPIMEKHKMPTIAADQWYSQQTILDILKDIEAEMGYEEMVAIGIKNAQEIVLPPEITTVEAAVGTSSYYYKSVTRNVPAEEGITVEKIRTGLLRVTGNIPAPPFIIYGVLHNYARRFKGIGEIFLVELTNSETPFVIDVKWGLPSTL